MKPLLCPVCNSNSPELFIERKNVPVHQNFLFNDFNSAREATRGDLRLFICHECSFVFNAAFDINKIDYGIDYDNSQTFSPLFSKYIDDLVNYIIIDKNIKGSNIIEVGCGKGAFLKRLISHPESDNIGYGFDSSYIGELQQYDGRLNFFKKYYGSEFSDIKADILVCRHVIEHIHEPFEFLISIKEALNENTEVFFETPCINWILENKVYFDFFYEHVSYFNKLSLTKLFQRAGFNVTQIKQIFGNQYMWLEAVNKVGTNQECDFKPADVVQMAQEMSKYESQFIDYWNNKINSLLKIGGVAIWGAGAKGVTFANLIDPDNKLISAVIDLNPNKHNKYLPGTGHIITDYKKIPELNIKFAIVMNENYNEENQKLLRDENIEIEFFDCNLNAH